MLVDAPERPGGVSVHWLVYDLPPDLTGSPEGLPREGHTLEQATITGTYLRPTWPWG